MEYWSIDVVIILRKIIGLQPDSWLGRLFQLLSLQLLNQEFNLFALFGSLLQ